MNKIVLTIALGAFAATSFAQTNALNKYFSQYQEDERFTKVHVTQKAFELLHHIDVEGKEEQEFKELMQSFTALDVLASEDMPNATQAFNSALKEVGDEFEELMSVDEKDGSFRFFIDETKGVVHEFLLIGKDKKEFILLSITGHMELSKISKFASMAHNTGMKHVAKMPEDVGEIKVRPNPIPEGGNISLTLPESFDDCDITVYNMNGAKVLNAGGVKNNASIGTSALPAGYYVMHLQKDGTTVKKKFLVK